MSKVRLLVGTRAQIRGRQEAVLPDLAGRSGEPVFVDRDRQFRFLEPGAGRGGAVGVACCWYSMSRPPMRLRRMAAVLVPPVTSLVSRSRARA